MSSTKQVGLVTSKPLARPTMRRLLHLFLFLVSSVLYSRAFTLVWSVWSSAPCSATVSSALLTLC